MARDYIGQTSATSTSPKNPTSSSSSNKDAQEAHEAIRPTDARLTPSRIRSAD